jgi:uncharacterized membrane protein
MVSGVHAIQYAWDRMVYDATTQVLAIASLIVR